MKYFEIDLGKRGSCDEYSICIRGLRKPTKKEAKKFLEKDMKNLGYDIVKFVCETTLEEAKDFYYMENESDFPIFH